jgi:hypothetical protein
MTMKKGRESNEDLSLRQEDTSSTRSLLSIQKIHTLYLESVVQAIHDSEMKKAKRIRDVLKTTEKILQSLEKNEEPDLILYPDTLISLKDALQSLQSSSDAQAILQLCGTIDSKLDGLIKVAKEKVLTKELPNDLKSPKKKKKKTKSPKKQ